MGAVVFSIIQRVLYWTQPKNKKRGRPGNEASLVPRLSGLMEGLGSRLGTTWLLHRHENTLAHVSLIMIISQLLLIDCENWNLNWMNPNYVLVRVCNIIICLPGTSFVTLSMVMHITKPHMYSSHWKNLSSWRNTHANTRSLTLVWWFTSASFLRRSSTIWSWPFQLATYNAVWPVCTCIKIKKVTFNSNHVTQHLFTATSWFCVAVMWPKVGEESCTG